MTVRFLRAKLTHKVVDLDNFNRMEEVLEQLANMTTDQHFVLVRGAPNYMLGLRAPPGISYADFAFGFTIVNATVTVKAGKVRHGTRTPITVAETAIVIGADNTWIYVEYVSGSGVAAVLSSTTEPVTSEADSTFRRPLYLVTLANGRASIGAGNIRHLGDVEIDAEFG